MSSVLVDFYNLHLRLGCTEEKLREIGASRSFDHKTGDELHDIEVWAKEAFETLIPPDKNERQQIIDFFENYIPDIVRTLTEEEKQRVREYKVTEKNYSDTLEEYEVRNGKSWFDSKDFIDFIQPYRYIKVLIDEFLDGSVNSLCLFAIEFYLETTQEARIYKYDKSERYIVSTLPDIAGKISFSLDEYYVFWRPTESRIRAGIRKINDLFLKIYEKVKLVLQGKMRIERCAAYQTTRIPACRNIFMQSGKQGPEQQFCSDKCRKRIYEHEKKHPEDRAKRYAILDAKMKNRR